MRLFLNKSIVKILLLLLRRFEKLQRLFNEVHNESQLKVFQRFDTKSLFLNSWDREKATPEYWRALGYQIYLVTDLVLPKNTLDKFTGVLPSVLNLTKDDIAQSVFFCVFETDDSAVVNIRKIISEGGYFVPHLDPTNTPFRFSNRGVLDVLKKTWGQKDDVSHLDINIHENLCEALELTKNIEGDVLEIGVYKGGSALTLLNYLDHLATTDSKQFLKKVYLLDTYIGFDYAQAKTSPDQIWDGTHWINNAKEQMRAIGQTLQGISTPFIMKECNICVDQIPSEIHKLSLVNIDVDMYEPTRDALNKVAPLVQPGGVILVEDATSTPALYGALVAMQDFLENGVGQEFLCLHKVGQYMLIRKAINQ
jgi:hypothetical protein